MPRATGKADTRRVELKTLAPEITGEAEPGFVVLRPLTYGEQLERREIASRFETSGGRSNRTRKVEMRVNVRELQVFDFARCVIDHNLDDDDGKRLDFSRESDVVKLNPYTAAEIEEAIDDMHAESEVGEAGESGNPTSSNSESSSETG